MTDGSPDDEGGDPVCWMDRVCPECGLFRTGDAAACERCGTATESDDIST